MGSSTAPDWNTSSPTRIGEINQLGERRLTRADSDRPPRSIVPLRPGRLRRWWRRSASAAPAEALRQCRPPVRSARKPSPAAVGAGRSRSGAVEPVEIGLDDRGVDAGEQVALEQGQRGDGVDLTCEAALGAFTCRAARSRSVPGLRCRVQSPAALRSSSLP